METPLLRPIWGRIARQAWILALAIFVVLAAIRAYGLFGPESARMFIMVGFFAMWFVPIIFLSKGGRRTIGLTKVAKPAWLLWAPLLGAAAGLVTFGIAYWLYGSGPENPFMSILGSYEIDDSMASLGRVALFTIFTIPAILFSPVGEEILFRGVIHESVLERWGPRIAVAVNCAAFGLVHLLHHGLQPGHVLLVSGFLWFALMVGTAWVFTLCRRRGGSLWPAILAHAAFNLAMNAAIFLVLF